VRGFCLGQVLLIVRDKKFSKYFMSSKQRTDAIQGGPIPPHSKAASAAAAASAASGMSGPVTVSATHAQVLAAATGVSIPPQTLAVSSKTDDKTKEAEPHAAPAGAAQDDEDSGESESESDASGESEEYEEEAYHARLKEIHDRTQEKFMAKMELMQAVSLKDVDVEKIREFLTMNELTLAQYEEYVHLLLNVILRDRENEANKTKAHKAKRH
jgi:hypothetical protein